MRLMPTVRTLPLLTPMALGLALATPSCLSNTNPHDDEVSSFPLDGRHAAIPCESCHGDDGFDALPAACESCHADERPPDHYPGGCGDGGCHTAVGWEASGGVGVGDDDDTPIPGDDDDVPPGDDDDTPITGDDDDDTTGPTTGPTTGLGHDFLPLTGPHDLGCSDCHADIANPTERLVCQDCHDADRYSPYHYAGQDCAHCHPVQAGWGGFTNHPFTLPHPDPTPLAVNDGCVNDPAPVPTEECIQCHSNPNQRDDGNASCIGCHAQAETDCRHANGKFPGYVYADTNCKACHPDGQG